MAENDAYKQTIRELSDRLVDAQRPIRILDAIKWSPAVRDEFFATGCERQPRVDRSYYETQPLAFDAAAKRKEFQELERDINRRLGQFSAVGMIMRRMCTEYQTVVRMLEARGLPEFPMLAQELYGSAGDVFHAGDPTLADLADMMTAALTNIGESGLVDPDEKVYDSERAVVLLQEALDRVFDDPEHPVNVVPSDGIIADAAAGADYIKIRKDARFSRRDLRLLEVHEGWVHLGTTLNGMSQPVCTFLSKGPPSSTVTQEGLAILMEIIAFASFPARLWRIANRIRAIDMAEKGATFLDVFRLLREHGGSDDEAYAGAARVFRGSTPEDGPFTKDIVYCKGFVLTYNFIQLAVRKGLLGRVQQLFCGKTTLEDSRALAQLIDEGIVAVPRHLPPMVADLNALSAWMCLSSFLNGLDLERIAGDYASLL